MAALSGRPYANYFSVLRELTNTGDNIIKFLRENLLALLDGAEWPSLSLYSYISQSDKRGKQLNILSVGYGTGIIEAEALTLLKPHFARVRFDGVEPNKVHERQFHERLDNPHPIHFTLMDCVRAKGFDLNTNAIPLEQFEPEAGVSYDLILLSHVLYYPADRAAAIRRVVSFLSPGGVLIIFQQTPAGLNEVQRLFAAEMDMPPHYYSSLEAQIVLQAEGIDFQTTLFDQVLDVTDALKGDTLMDIPDRGIALISFLCERDLGGLRETSSSSIDWLALQRLRDFLRRTSFVHPSTNKSLIFYPTAAIVAKRRAHMSSISSMQSLSVVAAAHTPLLPPRVRPWTEFRNLDLETIVLRSALLPDLLRLRAEQEPNNSIVEFNHGASPVVVSAAKFYQVVRSTAFGLHAAGVRAKDRVALLGSPSASCLVLLNAVWYIGGVVVPLALALPVKSLIEQLGIAQCSLLLVSEAWAASHPETINALQTAPNRLWRLALFDQQSAAPRPAWADLAPLRAVSFDATPPTDVSQTDPAIHPDDLAAILFSSGTTGSPKAVPLTHLNITFSAHTRNAPWSSLVNSSTRVLGWMPLNHVMGLVVEWATTALYSGGTYLIPPATLMNQITPAGLLSFVATSRATTLSCVPWMLSQFKQLALVDKTALQTLQSLRYILYGGAPMERNDVEWLRAHGVRLQQGMGMTEVGTLFVEPANPTAPADELCPLPGFHYRLRRTSGDRRVDVTNDDSIVTGEVLVKSLSVTSGYLNRPAGEGFTSDGYYCTGDMFTRLPSGNYKFECRIDDLLVLSTGEKLNPVQIEAQIREAAAPLVGAVCLLSGPVLPIAVVEPNWKAIDQHITLAQMQNKVWETIATINETLPSWARMQRSNIWVLDRHEPSLPTTRKHVVDRPMVRKRFEAALEAPRQKARATDANDSAPDPSATRTAQGTEVEKEILKIVEDILAIRLFPADVNRSLIELGLSSFFAIQLAVALKQRWSHLTTAAILSAPTIVDLAHLADPAPATALSPVVEAVSVADSLVYFFTRKPAARMRLVLVNDMGGTATDFTLFDRLMPPEIEVVALNLPGHRGRAKSNYFPDIPALTRAFIAEAVPHLSDKPVAFYGQCMGGHVSYEIALAIQEQKSVGLCIKAVAVGGSPSPTCAAVFKKAIKGSTPTEEELKNLLEGSAEAGAGGSKEKKELLLAELYEWYRDDMLGDHAMYFPTLERYLDPKAPPPALLNVPLIASVGKQDDTLSVADVANWHQVAGSEFELKVLANANHALFVDAKFITWLAARLLAQ